MTASRQTNRGPRKRSRQCPSCSSDKVLLIEYGLPTGELFEESLQGKVFLGGCCISDESPKWHCVSCENEWGRLLSD